MARRSYDEYEREMRDRRGRDPREIWREQGSPERMDSRDRVMEGREPVAMDYPRNSPSDIRTIRDSALRPVHTSANQGDRNDPFSRGYMDDSQGGIDPRTLAQREPSSRQRNDYFLPGEDINREVITADICRYLGRDTLVRPYTHPDGRQGYLITASQALTSVSNAQIVER